MCLPLVVVLLLLAMLAGYMVLIKAYEQKDKLKLIGQIISWIVIVTAFVGMLCSTAAIHCHSKRYKGFCNKSYKSKQCSLSDKSKKAQCSLGAYGKKGDTQQQ